jgi:uncharacterized membrane protein
MEERPKIVIELTSFDKALEIIGWILIILIWILTIYKYPALPETVPTHFNISGKVDDNGARRTVLILPIVSTILFAGLTILNKYPNIFNYPVPITEENAERLYRIATRLMRYLKLVLVLTFFGIEFMTIQTALGKSAGLTDWFLPVCLGSVFIPVIYTIFQLLKYK